MEGAPSEVTLLVGVAERDIGAFRALYERHVGWRSGSRKRDRQRTAEPRRARCILRSTAQYRTRGDLRLRSKARCDAIGAR